MKRFAMDGDQLILDRRKLNELARRLKNSALQNIGLWLFLAIFGNWLFKRPFVVSAAAAVFLVYIFIRLKITTSILQTDAMAVDQVAKRTSQLRVLCLLSTTIWGLTVAYIYLDPLFVDNRAITVCVQAFVAGTVITSFSIDRVVGKWSSLLILMPLALALIYNHFTVAPLTREEYLLVFLQVFGCVFLIRYNRDISNDFDVAQINRLKADTRAEKMHDLSTIDGLTRVNNRLFFDNYIQRAWSEAKKNRTRLSVLLIDLDHFKSINDTYGHLFGDECLQEVASALRVQLRQDYDCFARYGGEEFVLIVEDSEEADVYAIASRLLKVVRGLELNCEGKLVKITCSIGIGTVRPHLMDSFSSVVALADKALYRAKKNGRDRISVADKSDIAGVLSLIERTMTPTPTRNKTI